MTDAEEPTPEEPGGTEPVEAPSAADRLAVVAATAAVSVAVGGALLELCYTLFRW